MQIARTDIYRFHLPFVRPIRVGRELLTVREGLILALTDTDGRTGYGEIAPLPGFDETTLGGCLRELKALSETLEHAPFRHDRFDLAAPLLGLLPGPTHGTCHTLFGIESALLCLWLQQRNAGPAEAYPSLPAKLRIPVNGLFTPNPAGDQLAEQVRVLQESGARTVKVKIGRIAVDDEIAQILALCARMGSGLLLRLDGNRNLSAAAYRRYTEALRHLRVEYVEEPFREGEIPAAGEWGPWPLALDESLAGLLDPSEPRPSRLPAEYRTIILKPGLLMGLHGMARCLADAGQAGIQAVLSSAFNTGLTVSLLGLFAHLAALPPGTAHGLDTLRFLAHDLLPEPPVIRGGMLQLPKGFLSGGWHPDHRHMRRETG